MAYIVGLTGGVGSGKSTAAQYFAEMGAPIIDADKIAHQLVTPNQPAFKKIVERFGEKIVLANGTLNRSALRDIIFDDSSERVWLEDLLHPRINQTILNEIQTVTYPYCIVMIPLLVEHYEKYQHILDYVIVMKTSVEQQLEWGAKRENTTTAEIQKIIDAQATQEERNKIANTILDNEGSLQVLKDKVQELHQVFMKHQHAD
jgi:dephospho-CoA kinase